MRGKIAQYRALGKLGRGGNLRLRHITLLKAMIPDLNLLQYKTFLEVCDQYVTNFTYSESRVSLLKNHERNHDLFFFMIMARYTAPC